MLFLLNGRHLCLAISCLPRCPSTKFSLPDSLLLGTLLSRASAFPSLLSLSFLTGSMDHLASHGPLPESVLPEIATALLLWPCDL